MTTIIAIIDDDAMTMMIEKQGPQGSKVLPWRAFLGPFWPGWFLCSPSEPSKLLGRQQAGPSGAPGPTGPRGGTQRTQMLPVRPGFPRAARRVPTPGALEPLS